MILTFSEPTRIEIGSDRTMCADVSGVYYTADFDVSEKC